MVRPTEQRAVHSHNWSLLGRCYLWCLLAALVAILLFSLGAPVILLLLFVVCPVAAVWLYAMSERPLPVPLDPCPGTRGRTLNWIAPWYERCCARLGLAHAFRVRLIEASEIQEGDHVLDMGCGTGRLACLAAFRAGETGRVCGIDAAPNMIRIARVHPMRAAVRPRFELALAEALPFPDASFDVVLASFLLSALPPDLKLAALKEASRVLKPDGRLIVAEIDRPTSLTGRLLGAMLGLSAKLRSHVRGRTDEILKSGGFVPDRTANWRSSVGIWNCRKAVSANPEGPRS
jgi:ubiquinone/menaquinone biosynthesis C-methylase UbiE